MRFLAACALTLFISLAPVFAVEYEGVTFPDSVTVDGKPLVINGTGVRAATIFNIRVYAAALYLPEKNTDRNAIVASSEPKQLVMQFLREIGKDEMQKAWKKSFGLNNPDADARAAQLDDFISVIGNMEVGSRIVLTFTSHGVTLEGNSGVSKSVEDPGFGAAILRIWLGDSPPDSGLQVGLLGKA